MAGVIASPIPNQHGLFLGRDCRRELSQEDVDHFRVEQRSEQPFGLAGFGTDRPDDPQVFVLDLAHGRGTRTRGSPNARQRALLPEAGFVLKEDAELFRGVLLLNLRELLGQLFFLNSSCRDGSVRGCRGRGTSEENPSRCSR